MKRHILAAASLVTLAMAAVPAASFAQGSGSGLSMPYQPGFWGYAGIAGGRAEVSKDCTSGLSCDKRKNAWRIYGGGSFNQTFGGEISYLDFGNFNRDGGSLHSKALDLSLVAGIPFAQKFQVFGKLGATYSKTDVSATAPGVATGSKKGWGPHLGVGVQWNVVRNWAVRLDLDRYRLRMPSGRDNVDTLMLGAQYNFGGGAG